MLRIASKLFAMHYDVFQRPIDPATRTTTFVRPFRAMCLFTKEFLRAMDLFRLFQEFLNHPIVASDTNDSLKRTCLVCFSNVNMYVEDTEQIDWRCVFLERFIWLEEVFEKLFRREERTRWQPVRQSFS